VHAVLPERLLGCGEGAAVCAKHSRPYSTPTKAYVVAGVAESRASAEEIQSSGLMLLLLKSFGMLCAWKGPPAGSEKHPRDVNP